MPGLGVQHPNPGPTCPLNHQWVLLPPCTSSFHLNKGKSRKHRLKTMLSRVCMGCPRKETRIQLSIRSFRHLTCDFNPSKTLRENRHSLPRDSSSMLVVTCSDVMVNAFHRDNGIRNSFPMEVPHHTFDAAMDLLSKHNKKRGELMMHLTQSTW